MRLENIFFPKALRSSIAARILKSVFAVYLAIAIALTAVQISLEYSVAKQQVIDNIETTAHSALNPIIHALWIMDSTALESLLEGLTAFPEVGGAIVLDEDGKTFGSSHDSGVEASGNPDRKRYATSLDLSYATGGRTFQLGTLKLFSESGAVWQRIRVSVAVQLANSFIKTAGLWIILLWFADRMLRRHLQDLASQTKRITLDNLQKVRLQDETDTRSELKLLERSVNEMIDNLDASQKELKASERKVRDLNRELERNLEQLAHQKTELRLILDTIPAYIWYKDDQNRILRVNQAAASSVGMQVEDVEGARIEDIFPEEAADYYADDLAVIRSGKPKLGYIESYTPNNGPAKWIRTDKIPFKLHSESSMGVLVIATDVTESMLQQEALRVSKERYDLAVQGSSVGIWDWSPVDGSLYWSPRFMEIVGICDKTFTPHFKEFENRLHPEDHDRIIAAVQDHIDNRKPYDVQYRLLHENGSYIWVHASGQAIWDENDRPLRMAGSVRDISDEVAAKAALQESEARFRRAAEGSSVGIWDWPDMSTDTIWWAPRFHELLGYQPGEGIDPSVEAFRAIVHPDDVERTFSELDLCIAERKPFLMDYRLKTKSGEYQWFLGSGIISYDSQGNPQRMTGSVQDIDSRKRSEEEQRSLNSKLAVANKELSNFAYITSHDLREPLRSISSFIQLLKADYGPKLDADANEYMDFAIEGAHRLQNMIKSLLLYSRIDQQEVNETFILAVAAKRAAQELDMLVSESRATIDLPIRSPSVEGDINQIIQVFQNLITNAIKFRSDQDPRISIAYSTAQGRKLRDELEPDRDYCLVSFGDNGIGIDPSYHDRVFAIFQKLHSDSEYEGNGIGLALCNKIVVHHGGTIWVESKEGQGSIFKFALPISTNSSNHVSSSPKSR